MREVTVYYAYDDTMFENREECLEYEKPVLENFKIFASCYKIFNKDKKQFFPPNSDNIEDWFKWINNALYDMYYIERHQLPEEVDKFIDQFNFCILNRDFYDESGLFYWDEEEMEWVKVDE